MIVASGEDEQDWKWWVRYWGAHWRGGQTSSRSVHPQLCWFTLSNWLLIKQIYCLSVCVNDIYGLLKYLKNYRIFGTTRLFFISGKKGHQKLSYIFWFDDLWLVFRKYFLLKFCCILWSGKHSMLVSIPTVHTT